MDHLQWAAFSMSQCALSNLVLVKDFMFALHILKAYQIWYSDLA